MRTRHAEEGMDFEHDFRAGWIGHRSVEGSLTRRVGQL
jgi:hypothetical protein